MRLSGRRPLAAFAALALATVGLALGAAPGAQAQAGFAPADEATIHPGVMMFTDGAQCTANFIFQDVADAADGTPAATYIGYAAHCAGLGGSTDTNGCLAGSLPIGQEVEIDGADHPGTLAYSSWDAMQDRDEQDLSTCLYNDFALVEIDPRDVDNVNPSVPHWGGPTALGEDTEGGSSVYSYGNSSLRLGISTLSPKEGLSLGTLDGWVHPTYTLTPGIPGDSGSGLLDDEGRAVGVLSTLVLLPFPGSNNYSDLESALRYANDHGDMDVRLVEGDVAFDGGPLPLGGLGL